MTKANEGQAKSSAPGLRFNWKPWAQLPWTRDDWTEKDVPFVFRFSGFARAPRMGWRAKPYHLVGVGHLTLMPTGKLQGSQKSTSIPMQGCKPEFSNNEFQLEGDYGLLAGGKGGAIINFYLMVNGNKGPVVLQGGFDFVYQGARRNPNRLWLISSQTTDLDPSPDNPDYKQDVDELVSGEAVAI